MAETADERRLRERANDVTDFTMERAGEALGLPVAYENLDEQGRLRTGYRDKTPEQCLALIQLLDEVTERLAGEIGDLVYNGRENYGRQMSWARIGAVLGVTKQAAWDRFDRYAPGDAGDPFDPGDELWTALPVYPTEAAYTAAHPHTAGGRAEEGVAVDEDGIRWRLTLIPRTATPHTAAATGTDGAEGGWRETSGLARGQVIAIALDSPDAPRVSVIPVDDDGQVLINADGTVTPLVVDAIEGGGAHPGTVRILAEDIDLYDARTIIGVHRRRSLPALAVALSEAGEDRNTAAAGTTPA